MKGTLCPDADVVAVSSGIDADAMEEADDAGDCVLIFSGDVVDSGSGLASLSRTRIVIVLVGSVPVSFIIYGSLFATPYAL